jgi:hypothetical protein
MASLQQLVAASALITTLERIVGDGLLDPEREMKARQLIVRCCNAFEIPTIAERPAANCNADYETQLSLVGAEIGSPAIERVRP